MSKAYKCDRCGDLFEVKQLPKANYTIQNFDFKIKDIDLCPNCTDTFVKGMNGEINMTVFGSEETADGI